MSNLLFVPKKTSISPIYKKTTVGGWTYAVDEFGDDNTFYAFEGKWFFVVKDSAKLRDIVAGTSWLTSADPYQTVSITDDNSVTKSIPLNHLIITRVTSLDSLFAYQSNFNQFIGNWDVSKVTHTGMTFRTTKFDQELIAWDMGSCTWMDGMFESTPFNRDISTWDVSKVTQFRSVFWSNTAFNQDIGNWDVSKGVNLSGFFAYNTAFNQDISRWNTQNTNEINNIFVGATSFNQDISSWNMGNCAWMLSAFNGATSFNQDLSGWCVSKVADRYTLFDKNTPSWTLPKPNFANPPC